MKKITLLFILIMAFSFKSHAQFPEDFDGSASIPLGWAVFENGTGAVESWEINVGTTNNVALIAYENVTLGTAEDWLVTPQFTVDATNFILSFDQSDGFAPDYGSIYTIRVSTGSSQTNTGDFTIVDVQDETDVWAGGPLAQHTVDLSLYIGQSIYVAFVMENDDGDYWIIDNVDMIADATAPDPVTTPTPADMATDVYIDPTDGDNAVAFAWTPATTGDAATAYDVYLGDTATTLSLLGTLSGTSVNITGMEYSTEYFWQIIAKNVGGEAVGSAIWSFTTQADPALSVAEVETQKFKIYPNPVTDYLTIDSNLTIESVELTNQLGQVVLRLNSDSILNNTLDLSSISNGLYILKVNATEKTQTLKILKK